MKDPKSTISFARWRLISPVPFTTLYEYVVLFLAVGSSILDFELSMRLGRNLDNSVWFVVVVILSLCFSAYGRAYRKRLAEVVRILEEDL